MDATIFFSIVLNHASVANGIATVVALEGVCRIGYDAGITFGC